MSARLPSRVSDPHKNFLSFAGIQCVVLGILSIIDPTLWSSSAYSWVLDLVDLRIIGAVWLLLAAVAGYLVLAIKRTGAAELTALVAWQAVYTLVQFAFAWSIFTLTWNGAYGAIAGSIQWGGLAYVSWLWMRPETETPTNE